MIKLLFISMAFFISCNNHTTAKSYSSKDANSNNGAKQYEPINEKGKTIETRFEPPQGFERIADNKNSIAFFTRNLPLKKWGSSVLYYNGQEKTKPNVYASVIDVPIGSTDLHQCADAVMNIWALYLYHNRRFEEIQFKFLGDDAWHNFAKWSGGNYSKNNFTKYMEQVWSAANTRSLYTQLKPVKIKDAQIGDVLIVTGNPYGHAMMIMDECVNIKTKKKMYMLAQSYMPAQEMQILINPNSDTKSVWYSFEESTNIITPEWDFTIYNLMRF